MKYSRGKAILFWIFGGFLISVAGIIPSVFYWSITLPEWQLDIPGEIFAIVIMIPMGWFFCALIPANIYATLMVWISIIGFAWSMKTMKWKPLYISLASCFMFGIFWPRAFWTFMSV